MILHWSFAVDDPETVANALAEIVGGEVVEPPIPPYSPGAKWICTFDEFGSMIEVAPRRAVWVPDEVASAVETLSEEEPRRYTYNHALIRSAVSIDRVREIAERHGWHTRFHDGPFKFQGIWVENHQYVEFASDDLVPLYQKIFGSASSKDQLESHNRGRGETYEHRGTQASQTEAVGE
ncbi:hypothetical protein ACWEO2_36305 [Nocardia sp. NPDC004278]